MGKGGLAEAGRAVEEEVVQGLFALLRGLDGDGEVVLELLLPYELGEPPRTQSGVEGIVFVIPEIGGENAFFSAQRRTSWLRV